MVTNYRVHQHSSMSECNQCGEYHNTLLTLTEGLTNWILTCDGNYVRTFDTLMGFQEWLRKNDTSYNGYYQVIIVSSVRFIVNN
jgi:hypothetical protein